MDRALRNCHLFIYLFIYVSVSSSLPVSPPPPRLVFVCLSLVFTFPEPQDQFFCHWAVYCSTATHTSLTLHLFPAFHQYFLSGFKRHFAVGLQPSHVSGLLATFNSNMKSAQLDRGVVEPFLSRIFLLWRVAGPLA